MRVSLWSKYRYSAILLRELVLTEFKLRYQGSALGYLWSLLRPLFLFAILYTVFVFFLKVGSDIKHWPVQLLLGIVLWNFFAEVTNNGVASIVNRADVIRKINFPKYVIVLASCISALINLIINLAVIIVFMFISGVDLQWGVLLVPLFIAEMFIFALGITFLLSSLYVYFRDVNYIWEIIMQGLFYASIIIYPITMVIQESELYAKLLLLNPVAQIVQDTRHYLVSNDAITLLTITDFNYVIFAIPLLVVSVTFLIGVYVFKKQSPYFAEKV